MTQSAQRIRVTYIIAALVVGGAERQLLFLLQNIDRTRFDPRLVAFSSGRWARFFDDVGVPITVIPYRFGRIATLIQLILFFRKQKPDIVHTFGQSANYLGRIAAILAGVRKIIISERTSPTIKSGAKILLERLLARRTALLISNSRHGADFYLTRRILSAPKVTTIPNGIDATIVVTRRPELHGKKLVTIGDLRFEKNHADLLHIFAELSTRHPEAELHLIGDGPLRGELSDLARKLGIQSKVVFHGFVDDLRELIVTFDLYLHTARFEGLPNSVMEAMLLGIPCVAYDCRGCAELIWNEETGLLVRQGDRKSFAAAIDRLLTERELYRRLGTSAREFIRGHFSIPIMVARTVTEYEKVLAD